MGHKPQYPGRRTLTVAGPIRFRHSQSSWSHSRVDTALYSPLDEKFGATKREPLVEPPPEYDACRFEMDNGDLALFAWTDSDAYWLGNTETPQALWRTEKYTFDEVTYPLARWAQRELLEDLADSDPWLAAYDHVTWFFLPVFFSKDGRETTRTFFRDHAAGFPDADREAGLAFYEDLLSTGILDDYRYTMATKLGTSEQLDLVRMRAAMAELHAAKLLDDTGHGFTPEVPLDSGYALDFRADSGTLIEVTRPEPPARRRAGTPASALRETVDGKTGTQLDAHPGTVLFVDCTSFRDDEWFTVRDAQPGVGYTPAVVYRMRPDKPPAGYVVGDPGLGVARHLD
ncbi:hypothetical protein SAMN05216226_11153 [Halovenus aranensis]|uniref:Uncharacterized protein n=1 Tax=Halovenus aranensis TaxID=890420 RepID=A0A1G8XGK3_9EURY|nr:hypothetical protein SAMN05216226_11153 [Halovenus aranensis]